MNVNEKVNIELKTQPVDLNPPIKWCKSRNGKPSNNNFICRPRAFPQIGENVDALSWNSVAKTITISITETAEFEVYKWIKYIEEKSHEIQKSPFSDLDANCLVITFQDHAKKDIADIRFKNLSITNNECGLYKNTDVDGCDYLNYLITLSYQYDEFVLSQVKDPSIEFPEPPEDADAEWQTVSTP
jgi:hypothetical protein